MSVSIPNHSFTSAFVRGLMEVLRPKVRTAIRDLVKYYIEEYNKTSMMPFNLVCDFKRWRVLFNCYIMRIYIYIYASFRTQIHVVKIMGLVSKCDVMHSETIQVHMGVCLMYVCVCAFVCAYDQRCILYCVSVPLCVCLWAKMHFSVCVSDCVLSKSESIEDVIDTLIQ